MKENVNRWFGDVERMQDGRGVYKDSDMLRARQRNVRVRGEPHRDCWKTENWRLICREPLLGGV